jgi:hypothetical protein
MARTTWPRGSSTDAAETEPGADVTAHPADVAASSGARTGSLATLVGRVLTLVAALIGAGELHDNSFLTHLATGRWLHEGNLGRLWMGTVDPYLGTSTGRTWVVQSWFASVLYAGAETVAGAAGIRLLMAAVAAGIVAALWRLSAPGRSLVARTVAVGGVVALGGTVWSERPLMFGLLFMAVVLLAADGVVRTWWLVPVGWLWVNTHGSFPLGVVVLVALAVGARLDRDDAGRELRALRDLALGCLVGGVLSPVGPVLLTFPVTLLQRQDVLGHVQEWKRTDFTQGWAQLFAAFALLAVIGLLRTRRFRSTLPVLVFTVAGVLAARNVLVAAVVLSPFVAHGLSGIGSVEDRRSPALRAGTRAVAVLGPLLVLATAAQGDYRLEAYPVGAVDFLEQRGLLDGSVVIAEEDYVGNYLEWRYGPGVNAFIDDRYDLHDAALVDDYVVLRAGSRGWQEVLDRRRIDVVLWSAEEELNGLLAASPAWRLVHEQQGMANGYVVYCRVELARCAEPSR